MPRIKLLIALCLFSMPSRAQILGELRGQITDASGATLPGARITLTQLANGVSQARQTTSTGEYSYTHLDSGTYSVSVEQTGFSRLERSGITITTGQTVRLDLQDRKSTRLNSSHAELSRMPSSA